MEEDYDKLAKKLVCYSPINKGWVAGGAITSVFTDKTINDLDIYFKSKSQFQETVEQAFKHSMWCSSVTHNAVNMNYGSRFIQLMHLKWFDCEEEIFNTFDFTVCMGSLNLETSKFILHKSFLLDNIARRLMFNHNTKYPASSGVRVVKYIQRGYTISPAEMLKLMVACSSKPINSWKQLQENAGGAYGTKMEVPLDKEYSLDNAVKVIEEACEQETLFHPDLSNAKKVFAQIEKLKSQDAINYNLEE